MPESVFGRALGLTMSGNDRVYDGSMAKHFIV